MSAQTFTGTVTKRDLIAAMRRACATGIYSHTDRYGNKHYADLELIIKRSGNSREYFLSYSFRKGENGIYRDGIVLRLNSNTNELWAESVEHVDAAIRGFVAYPLALAESMKLHCRRTDTSALPGYEETYDLTVPRGLNRSI